MSTFQKYSSVQTENESSSDDGTDSSSDEQDSAKVSIAPGSSREKRNVSWCGIEDTRQKYFPMVRRVVWPPASTPQPSFRNAYVDPRSISSGNPKLGQKMQLYSKTGFFLGIYPNGHVRGTKDDSDEYTFLERKTGGLLPEHVKFQGMVTKLYVAMDKKGRLYAEPDPNSPATVFIESFHGSYNNYLSRSYAHLGWYIGLKRNSGYPFLKLLAQLHYVGAFNSRHFVDKISKNLHSNMEGEGTPFGNKMQLYCEHGYLLKIMENGEVSGTEDYSDIYTKLVLSSGDDTGIIRIKGLQSQLYICFDQYGNLYGETNQESPGTTFKEEFCGSYNAYENIDHPGWMLGLSKIGKAKNGNRTQLGKKSTKFLPIRV